MVKNKNKKITTLILAFSMMLGIAGCGKVSDRTTEDKIPSVPTQTDADKKTTEATEATTAETTTEATTETTQATEATTTETTTESSVDVNSDEAKAEQEKFDKYIDDLFKEEVVSDTLTLHYSLAHPENYGITDYEITLGDYPVTEEEMEADKKEIEDTLAEITSYNYDYLNADQKFLYDIIKDYCEVNLKGYENPYLNEPFAYTSGIQMNYPITMAEYKFYEKRDVEDYLKLLEVSPEYLQKCLDFEKVKSDKGLFMNDDCADEVIRQCTGFIEKPDENVLLATFETRLDKLEGLTDDEKKAYIEKNEKAVKEDVIPAYENIISTFEGLKGTGKNELGLAHFEGGKEFYKYLIQSKVGTDKTPEQIIEMLDKKVDETMNDFTNLAISNYAAYMSYAELDSAYGDIEYKPTIENFEKIFDERFPDIPDIDFTVDTVHESLKDSVSPAFFMTPPLDAYLNNSIYINEAGTSNGSLWATLAHEGVPGHMYQFVYFLSSNPNPMRCLLNFNGYEEGWAQYVERMSYEYYDGFEDPAYADFERINADLNLYVSSRIEIGINYEGWSIDDTKKYLKDNGFSEAAAEEIAKYVIAEPANYQMYCTGSLIFMELADYAKDELGNKYDEKEFHKTVLDAGPCQFYLLKNKVDEYIKNTK